MSAWMSFSEDAPAGRAVYLNALMAMGPAARLRKALELGELTRALFRTGLRERHPALDEAALQAEYLDGLAKCHNRNY